MAPIVPFALAGIILILGFIGNYLFKRISVPDILILIFLGYLIGPVLKILDPVNLAPVLPIFTSLALLLILFDGGLNLNLNKVIEESPRAIVLAIISFILSIMAVALFTVYVFNWNIITGIVLGAVLGGTSSSIVIPLVSRAVVSPKIKTLLSLESALTDALVVVASLALLPLLTAVAVPGLYAATAQSVTGAFSIGAFIGLLVGVLWLRVLHHVQGEDYDDVLTLAFLFLMYAVVESLGGNGAIFALVFGLVLGNGYIVSKMMRMREGSTAGYVMKKFQAQLSFLVRTFFFVYIGLIFSVTSIQLLSYTALICIILVGTRFIARCTLF